MSGLNIDMVFGEMFSTPCKIYNMPNSIYFCIVLELSCAGKVQRVLWHYIGKPILLLVFLYLFICSLSFLGDAFKLLGGKVLGACVRLC